MDSEAVFEENFSDGSSGDEVEFALKSTLHLQDKTEDYPFEVLSTDKIVQYMSDTIKEINTIVEMPATITRILLNHFKWDQEKLLEKFYDGNEDKLFADVHVVNPFKICLDIDKSKKFSENNSSDEMEICMVCFNTFPFNLMTGLECNHRYCIECWAEYLKVQIMDEGDQRINCIDPQCDILVDDKIIINLITESKVIIRYQHLITNSFVEYNKLLRWCPTPSCNYAIKVQEVDMKPVTCKCGCTFCFKCGENWHNPIQCNMLKLWLKKCNEDLETSQWILSHTKECPNCNAHIEKNGGCNHMKCKNISCSFEFCWICLGKWSQHLNGHCNTYQGEIVTDLRNSRAALQRYIHFNHRYVNHSNSLKFEISLYESVKQTIMEIQQNNIMPELEIQFLKKAVDVLCDCRQTLMYTYVLAYFLNTNNQVIIFEDNQKDLETATEILSEYLERDITCDNLMDIKQKVQDKYRYCDSRKTVLLEHVLEGYDKNWWKFSF